MERQIVLDQDMRRIAAIEDGFKYPPEQADDWKPGTYRVTGVGSFATPNGKLWDATAQAWI